MPRAEDEDSLDHFANVLCLGQRNLLFWIKYLTTAKAYLLIFAKGPQDLQSSLGVIVAGVSLFPLCLCFTQRVNQRPKIQGTGTEG